MTKARECGNITRVDPKTAGLKAKTRAVFLPRRIYIAAKGGSPCARFVNSRSSLWRGAFYLDPTAILCQEVVYAQQTDSGVEAGNRCRARRKDPVGSVRRYRQVSGHNGRRRYRDAVAPAKILKEYADKIETFEIRVGFLEGKVIDAATVNELADIPSKEILLSRFLGSIQSPISGFARAIQAIIDKQGEGAPAEEAPAAEQAAE